MPTARPISDGQRAVGQHGHSGGVVPAVLQAAQSFQDHVYRRAMSCVPYDAAHAARLASASGPERIRQPVRLVGLTGIDRLDHDPDRVLGPARPYQHPAGLA